MVAITYEELVDLIGETIPANDEETFVSHIDDFIIQAEDIIVKSCQLPVMSKTATGSLSIGVETLTLPSDYIAPLQLFLTVSSNRYQLKHKEGSFLVAAYPSTASGDRGQPAFYAQGDNADTSQIRLAPIPDAAYSYTLEYSHKPASLTEGAGGGTTWISTHMRTALVYGALMFAADYILDAEAAAMYEKKFMTAAGLTKAEQEGKARTDRRRREYVRPNVQE